MTKVLINQIDMVVQYISVAKRFAKQPQAPFMTRR
jgi:hypothetical protein